MSKNKVGFVGYIWITVWIIIVMGILFSIKNYFDQKAMPTTDTDCVFMGHFPHGEDIQISENNAGMYRYELKPDGDGIEIIKCDN